MRSLWRHDYRRGTLLSTVCLAIVGGIGLAHSGFTVSPLVVVVCLVGSWIAWRRHSTLVIIWLLVFGLALGCQRGALYHQKLAAYQPFYNQKVSLTVVAVDDGVYGKNSQITFEASHIQLDSGQLLAGQLQASGFGLNAVFQGDVVQVSGKLYPGFGQNQASIQFAQLELVAHHPGLVADIRRKFTAGMQTALPEPLAPFAMGLLIGQRATLPPTVKQDLLMVGLTHIIAVSGYNLTIMLEASQRLLQGKSKRLATALSLGLIGSFLLLAGSSASIVRAAIVSVLSIVTGYYGRQLQPLALILLAAAITAWLKPFYIWSDTSWYLSFLAFYGVMVLSPGIQGRWLKRSKHSIIGAVALESICAELLTLPFIVKTFGQLSLIGLSANVLVVALVPLAMLLSTIAGLAGMLVGPLAGWLAWPAGLLLTYMLDTAHLLAHIPAIFIQNHYLSTPQMLILYMLIVCFSVSLYFKTATKTATLTDSEQGVASNHVRSQQMVND